MSEWTGYISCLWLGLTPQLLSGVARLGGSLPRPFIIETGKGHYAWNREQRRKAKECKLPSTELVHVPYHHPQLTFSGIGIQFGNSQLTVDDIMREATCECRFSSLMHEFQCSLQSIIGRNSRAYQCVKDVVLIHNLASIKSSVLCQNTDTPCTPQGYPPFELGWV